MMSFPLLLLSSLALATAAPLYTLDTTWNPSFPAGAHTFSAVGVFRTFGSTSSKRESIVYVTQRGNASIPPVLMLDAADGSLMGAWGENDVAVDRSNPPAATWYGIHTHTHTHTHACERARIP